MPRSVNEVELERLLGLRDVANAPSLDVMQEIRKRGVGRCWLRRGSQPIEGDDGKDEDERPRDHPEHAGAWKFASEHGTPSAEEPSSRAYRVQQAQLLVEWRVRRESNALDELYRTVCGL